MTYADAADRPAPRERPWLLFALLVATFFGLSGGAVLLPHDPYVRYQQLAETIHYRTVWGYERLAFDKTPIDIAVIGNSRLQAGVSGPLLQDELSRRLGRPIHVANLSLPQEGRNAHFVVAKRLFLTHPEVKLVILSAIEQMPREGHPAFRNTADTADVVAAPLLGNTQYFSDLAYLPYRQMALFVQTLFPQAFGETRRFDRSRYLGGRYDTTLSFTSPTGNHVDRDAVHSAAELLPPARERVEGITPPLLPAHPDIEFAVERAYTGQVARLASANGTRVAFLYLPIYHYPLPLQDKDFYEGKGAVIEAPFLAADHRNYSDYGHLNRIGSTRLTQWLAGLLAEDGAIAIPRGRN